MKMDWKQIYTYRDGELERKESNNGKYFVGSVNSSGYLQTEHKQKVYMVHRIIWEMYNGEIPNGMQIDHIDRNPLNNNIENLRLATQAQNQINSTKPKNNTTGFKGVLATPNGKFQARLGYKGKKLYLGLFDTAEEAYECVVEVTKELHGEFATA
jgi:hypothetical protein